MNLLANNLRVNILKKIERGPANLYTEDSNIILFKIIKSILK